MVEEYCKVFEGKELDFIISPTSMFDEPPLVNDTESRKKPVYEYQMDYYTTLPNTTGTPCITIPVWDKAH